MILAAGLTDEEVAAGTYEMDVDSRGAHYLRRVYGRCVYLTAENDCSIYQDRPEVCRNYRCDTSGQEDRRIDRWLLSGGSRARH